MILIDSTDEDLIDGDSTGYSVIASGFGALVKAAVGDFGDAAGNVAAVASTCARRRQFGTADEENLEINADLCSARRLRAGASFLLQCRRRLGVVASGTCTVVVSSGTFYNRHHRRAWGSLFVQLLQGQRATSPQTGEGVIRCVALERLNVVASGTHAVASSGTLYNQRRVRTGAARSLFSGRRRRWVTALVRAAMSRCCPSSRRGRERLWIRAGQYTVVDICGPCGSPPLICRDVAAVASETRAPVNSSMTFCSRRRLRAGRLAYSVVLERFVAVASGTPAVVDMSATVHNR